MSANSLYIAYEDYLIGRVPSLSTYYFYGSDPGGANEKVALQLIKYAIEKLLNWTVDTAVKRFDEYIIKQLKLERIILYIDYLKVRRILVFLIKLPSSLKQIFHLYP